MTARTIARPTNVRTRPPPLEAVWVGPAAGRVSGVFSPVALEAARAGGAASSMPAQAAVKAVRRAGNILEGEDPVRGAGRLRHRRRAAGGWGKTAAGAPAAGA